jgi:hypothetical protein
MLENPTPLEKIAFPRFVILGLATGVMLLSSPPASGVDLEGKTALGISAGWLDLSFSTRSQYLDPDNNGYHQFEMRQHDSGVPGVAISLLRGIGPYWGFRAEHLYSPPSSLRYSDFSYRSRAAIFPEVMYRRSMHLTSLSVIQHLTIPSQTLSLYVGAGGGVTILSGQIESDGADIGETYDLESRKTVWHSGVCLFPLVGLEWFAGEHLAWVSEFRYLLGGTTRETIGPFGTWRADISGATLSTTFRYYLSRPASEPDAIPLLPLE